MSARGNSRPARWAEACSRARVAVDDLKTATEELESIRQEYEEWLDNLPENLASGALGEKLQAVCDLDFSGADEIDGVIDEAENADLPRGFGRD